MVGPTRLCYHRASWARRPAIIPDNPNWRRHKNACIHYRERWCVDDEPGDEGCGRLLYQIICLLNTPPVTVEEQQRCMRYRTTCWRLEEVEGKARCAAEAPPRQ